MSSVWPTAAGSPDKRSRPRCRQKREGQTGFDAVPSRVTRNLSGAMKPRPVTSPLAALALAIAPTATADAIRVVVPEGTLQGCAT